MARPPRVSDIELVKAFDSLKNGNSMSIIAKSLRLKDATLRYHFKRIYGKTFRGFRRLEPTFAVPENKTDLAYIAGIIDGEGWISPSGRGWQIGVGNTSRLLIDYLSKFGGLVSKREAVIDARIKSAKTQWHWKLTRAVDVLNFLVAVEPYLVIKRGRALEAISGLRVRFSATDDD